MQKSSPTRILIGIACHNRRETTRRCLNSLQKVDSAGLDLSITVFDDGSSDGTSKMILEEFPLIDLQVGDGNFFWAKSMSQIHLQMATGRFSGFLMLNDDVRLLGESFIQLARMIKEFPDSVLVGAMSDFDGGVSYSGLVCQKVGNYYKMKMKSPEDVPLAVDSFVGNFAYIPNHISNSIGYLDGKFSHHYADVEYGIRVRKNGFSNILLPNFVGNCEHNDVRTKCFNKDLSLRDRFAALNSRFCFPFDDHLRFYQSIGGNFWIYHFARSYVAKIFFVLFPDFWRILRSKPNQNS